MALSYDLYTGTIYTSLNNWTDSLGRQQNCLVVQQKTATALYLDKTDSICPLVLDILKGKEKNQSFACMKYNFLLSLLSSLSLSSYNEEEKFFCLLFLLSHHSLMPLPPYAFT